MKGRRALVTGGGRGIGEAIARRLAREGARVFITSRTAADLERVARETGSEWAACDVTAPEQVEAAVRKAGPIDILVNNAGVAEGAALVKTDLALWRRILETNLTSAFLFSKAVVPGMIERRYGRIVNVASVAGKRGAKYISAYAASKHGLLGLSSSLALELAEHGIRVNAVCPGYVDTPMTRGNVGKIARATGRPEADVRQALLASQAQSRMLTADEVADAALPLCRAECPLSGAAIDV